MTLIILYVLTFAIFLGLDLLGLSYLIKPVFSRDIGPLLLDQFRLLPAFVFYAFYIAVLLYFVSWPAIAQDKSLLWVFGNAALIGPWGMAPMSSPTSRRFKTGHRKWWRPISLGGWC